MIYRDKYIFVHVPKTGGLSISASLGGKDKKISTHTPLKCVPKGNRFAFGFMRNPWARMVSLYRFMCQKSFKRTDNFDQDAIRKMGFKKWLMDDDFFMQEDDHPQGEPWVMKTHWRRDENKDLPPMQRRPQMWWLEGCDYIGHFEDFPDSFDRACYLAGIQARSLPHVNKTKGGTWHNEYDEESKEFVAHHFKPDIIYGGYTFD